MSENADYQCAVKGMVPFVRQKGETCWAAAIAMMHGWNNQMNCTMEQALSVAGNRIDGTPYKNLVKKGQKFPLVELGNLALAMGMQHEEMRSFTAQQFFNLMCTSGSPMMVGFLYPGGSIAHFCVVTEMWSDDGLVSVRMNDPNEANEGTEVFFDGLYQNMERLTNWASVKMQILHY